MLQRGFWTAASLGIGLLQAWDSGALTAGPATALLTVAGIIVPTATIAMRMPNVVRIAALLAGALLLLIARILAPTALNAVHLALFPAALYILFLRGFFADGQQQSA
jgi:hypothetical protein